MNPLYGLDHCKEGQNFSDWAVNLHVVQLYDGHPEKYISVLREHKEIVEGIRSSFQQLSTARMLI